MIPARMTAPAADALATLPEDLKAIVRNLPLAACVGDSDPSAAAELDIVRWAMAHTMDAVLTTPASTQG